MTPLPEEEGWFQSSLFCEVGLEVQPPVPPHSQIEGPAYAVLLEIFIRVFLIQNLPVPTTADLNCGEMGQYAYPNIHDNARTVDNSTLPAMTSRHAVTVPSSIQSGHPPRYVSSFLTPVSYNGTYLLRSLLFTD